MDTIDDAVLKCEILSPNEKCEQLGIASRVRISGVKAEYKGKFCLGGYINGVISAFYAPWNYASISLTQLIPSDNRVIHSYETSESPFAFNPPRNPVIHLDYDDLIIEDTIENAKKRYEFICGILDYAIGERECSSCMHQPFILIELV